MHRQALTEKDYTNVTFTDVIQDVEDLKAKSREHDFGSSFLLVAVLSLFLVNIILVGLNAERLNELKSRIELIEETEPKLIAP